ncbi:MAG: hypothetical protein JNK90_02735 [Planctomycetaceae bacterium]|nr:hypothetical protein [Planctomycetaceae bacterium]
MRFRVPLRGPITVGTLEIIARSKSFLGKVVNYGGDNSTSSHVSTNEWNNVALSVERYCGMEAWLWTALMPSQLYQ